MTENLLTGTLSLNTTNNQQIRFCHRTASYKIQRGVTKQIHIQELWLLCSARRLLVLNTCMEFYEHILNGFKVIERT